MKNSVLKMSVFTVGLLTACVPAIGAETSSSIPSPKVDLTIESDLRVLAQGYVAAFAQFPPGARYVHVRSGDALVMYGSVNSLTAFGGVLLIRIDSGPVHAVNAGDVIRVTNEVPRQAPSRE